MADSNGGSSSWWGVFFKAIPPVAAAVAAALALSKQREEKREERIAEKYRGAITRVFDVAQEDELTRDEVRRRTYKDLRGQEINSAEAPGIRRFDKHFDKAWGILRKEQIRNREEGDLRDEDGHRKFSIR